MLRRFTPCGTTLNKATAPQIQTLRIYVGIIGVAKNRRMPTDAPNKKQRRRFLVVEVKTGAHINRKSSCFRLQLNAASYNGDLHKHCAAFHRCTYILTDTAGFRMNQHRQKVNGKHHKTDCSARHTLQKKVVLKGEKFCQPSQAFAFRLVLLGIFISIFRQFSEINPPPLSIFPTNTHPANWQI